MKEKTEIYAKIRGLEHINELFAVNIQTEEQIINCPINRSLYKKIICHVGKEARFYGTAIYNMKNELHSFDM